MLFYCDCVHEQDNFYIRQEMKYIFLCLLAMYSCYYTQRVLVTFAPRIRENDQLRDIIVFMTNQMYVAAQFGAMMISTFWVNQRCERIIKSNRFETHKINRKSMFEKQHTIHIAPKPEKVNKQIEMQMSMSSVDSNISTTSLQGRRSLSSRDLSGHKPMKSLSSESRTLEYGNEAARSLQSILADDQLLDLFAAHLSKEFCIECLLSLIEMQQFKSYLKEQLNVEYHVQIVDISPKCPRSQLVFREKAPTLETFKETAYELYRKYVEEGSEFEINIRSRMRRQYRAKMGEYDKWMASNVTKEELSWIFDDAMDENIKLLQQSMKRFHFNLKQMA